MSETYWTPERQKRQDTRIKQMDNKEIESFDFSSEELRKKFS